MVLCACEEELTTSEKKNMTQENERSKLEESRDEESSEGYVMPEMQNMKDSFDTFSLRADTFITKIKTL